MKCSVCKRVFEHGDTVMQTSLKDKTETVCDVKTKPSCAGKVDKGRGQQEAFPKDLWRTKTYRVHSFDCIGATVTKVDASYKDCKVIKVQLNLPGGASMDEISGFMGDVVRIELQKETLTGVKKPAKKSAPKQPGEKTEKKKDTGKK